MNVSVIICTRNRAYAILGCLESVAEAIKQAASVKTEIVVVDNGSTDNTSALVKEWSQNVPFPVQVQYEKNPGITNARNCGIRAAKGELLVFTDDDCRMDKDYINVLVRLDAQDKELVLRGGRVELGNPEDLPITILTSKIPAYWHKSLKSARTFNLGNCFAGCNMTMRRSVVEKLGPFDSRFGSPILPAAEDTDYAFRAYLAGIRIEYSPDIVVHHHHGRKKLEEGWRLMRNYMIATGGLYVKYFWRDPNLCRQFYWDLKGIITEWRTGKNCFVGAINFSCRDRFIATSIGAYRYIRLCLTGG